MKGSLYAIVYAAVLGAVCALLLTAAAGVTAPYRQANAEADEPLNILMVLNGVLIRTAMTSLMLNGLRQKMKGMTS